MFSQSFLVYKRNRTNLTRPNEDENIATLKPTTGRVHNFAESATDRIVRIPDPVPDLPPRIL